MVGGRGNLTGMSLADSSDSQRVSESAMMKGLISAAMWVFLWAQCLVKNKAGVMVQKLDCKRVEDLVE